MANGVKKTYRKLYWTNLGKMLNLLFDIDDGVEKAKEIGAEIMDEYDIYPILADDNGYKENEREYLQEIIDEAIIDKLQKKATKYANRRGEKSYISGYGGFRAQPQHYAFQSRSTDTVFVDKLRYRYIS